MKINNMKIEIIRNFYHKSTIAPDGITHTIDTSQKHTVYQLGMAKNYFTEDKNQVIDNIIQDLRDIITELERLRDKEKDNEDRS